MEPKQDYQQQQPVPMQPMHTSSQQMVPQQPQQQHAQTQQTQNANANLDPRGSDWQIGLFDCFSDMEACLIAYFLPCMLHGKTMDRMRDPSLQSHDPLNNECMIWGGIQCFTCCGWLYNMVKRTEIREKYGIQGSGGSDCCTSYCCLCCALVQQDREVALRAGHYAPVTQGYQAQTHGMQMPAPVHAAQPHPQHQQSFHGQSPPPQQAYQQSPPPQQVYQQTPPPQQQQQYQQPMQSGIQSAHEQGMPTYPHEGQYGQKQ
ncbi:protein family Cys-rich [Pochonia chlamydosporia 170]|uniref:Protein family Cys-rich n=1 Tax=Pochonia chlamydosporia 170 TaxID=1380566 RepID=A0A179FNX2_METCM|nr:protein family Cys-rich [Pochonia chlamydosporia 170]OAQ66930.1 protein family Cys-rich [Pochonia chlamydosporia 170]